MLHEQPIDRLRESHLGPDEKDANEMSHRTLAGLKWKDTLPGASDGITFDDGSLVYQNIHQLLFT